MKEYKTSVGPSSFPGNYVSNFEKNSFEFGLKIGQAIQYEWFRRDKNGSKFFNQWDNFHKLRLYARAEQPIGKYKNEIAVDGDLSYLNLDWTPVPIIPKFVDIVVNGFINRLLDVKAQGQDHASIERKKSHKQQIQADMVSKPLLQKIKKNFGVDAFTIPEDELPNNQEELQLRMQLNYKDDLELAEEAAINTVLLDNKYEDIKKRLIYDLVTLGVCHVKHNFLPGEGAVTDYVDPANVVYSYTEDPNFKDCFYWGEVKDVPITELIKIDPNLSEDDLKIISNYGKDWRSSYNNSGYYNDSIFNEGTVSLLYFNYETVSKTVFKKKGEKVIEKDDTWDPPLDMMEERGFEKIESLESVWYDGIMVLGTDIVLKWEKTKNITREKTSPEKSLSNYVGCAPRMYKGVIESLLRRMIPFGDLIQMTHLKLQQVVQKVVPDGVFIDADGLNEVDLGNGSKYNPEEALKLYFQTGSVIGRSYNQDGEYNHGKVPIQELSKNSGQAKISSLIGSYNHYLQMLRDVTGLNEARDGSMPDPHSLVGLQKIAALNSNTATRHIKEAIIDVTRDLSTAISCRISDALEHSDHKEDLVMKIGRYNVDLLDQIRQLHIHDFAIYIEVAPDEEERQQLENNMQIALSKDSIDLDDVIDIREIKNVKLANQLLKVKKKRREKERREYEMQKIASQQEGQLKSQQLAAQTAAEKIELEALAKMNIAQAQAGFEIEKMNNEASLKKELMNIEFNMNMKLKGIEVDGLASREKDREKSKDDRISKQNSQQSKLIDQRKNNLGPINFESTEDTLDGFDLSEFGPR